MSEISAFVISQLKIFEHQAVVGNLFLELERSSRETSKLSICGTTETHYLEYLKRILFVLMSVESYKNIFLTIPTITAYLFVIVNILSNH